MTTSNSILPSPGKIVLFSFTSCIAAASVCISKTTDILVFQECGNPAITTPPCFLVCMGGKLANQIESHHETLVRHMRDMSTAKLILHIVRLRTGQDPASNAAILQVLNNMPENAKTVLTAYMWAAGIGLSTYPQDFLSVSERQENYHKMALTYKIPVADVIDEMDWAFVGTFKASLKSIANAI